jgi:dienelactone hydrolase
MAYADGWPSLLVLRCLTGLCLGGALAWLAAAVLLIGARRLRRAA